eukprot:TRINITY_DN6430_c1_g1_i1.p1 TRINITY_DN6430_c1_g1~~TRINITY_DN6430_c1_g1_i1.p1  ORF type:complete len:198 (+),score=29.70 TRINITY_DN6430_c1_g1_i1:416-1009(+)
MVKGFSQEYIYRHPWERVTAANWRKYTDPDPYPGLSHVLEVDTVARTLDSTTGLLNSTRLITVNAPGPSWLQRILGETVCHICEHSTVDAKSRHMELVSRNVTLKDFLEVEERCTYTPHPANPDWTLFRQETVIRCAALTALSSIAGRIEQRLTERFLQNASRGRETMEQVCRILEAEVPDLSAPRGIGLSGMAAGL